jgi:hypothetical protein
MDRVESGLGDVVRIGLVQNRFRWRATVNALMNIGVQNLLEKPSNGYTTCVASFSVDAAHRMLH